jgi:molecular chaperone HscB
MNCWNCNIKIGQTDLFCPSCGKIQPPSQADHFALFAMPRDFDLGVKKLEVAYFSLQMKLHPDRFSQKSEQEKIFSMQQSMSINKAFETLKSPLPRAEYMLKLHGIIVNTENSTIKPSQAVLQESMEMREQLLEANTPDKIRTLTITATDAKLSTIDAIKQNFIDVKLEDAAQNTIKLRYLEKLMEEIKIVNRV